MTNPCTACVNCVEKQGVAGKYYCDKKKAITSIARITNDGQSLPVGKADDCFEKINESKGK